LCGRHRRGLGVELPALEPRELEVELVDLDSGQRDLALAPGQLLRIGLGLLLQPLDQCGHLGRQARQIDGFGSFTRHAPHGAAPATGKQTTHCDAQTCVVHHRVAQELRNCTAWGVLSSGGMAVKAMRAWSSMATNDISQPAPSTESRRLPVTRGLGRWVAQYAEFFGVD